jgi:hypothetical protein
LELFPSQATHGAGRHEHQQTHHKERYDSACQGNNVKGQKERGQATLHEVFMLGHFGGDRLFRVMIKGCAVSAPAAERGPLLREHATHNAVVTLALRALRFCVLLIALLGVRHGHSKCTKNSFI